jgi:transposase
VSGLRKRDGKVFAAVIPGAGSSVLMPVIREKTKPDSAVYTDSLSICNVPGVSEFRHLRINHSEQFADSRNHINGIENFWNQAKRHLRKFNGIPREHFYLYLKECEWRFNYSSTSCQLKQLLQWSGDYLG